MKLLGECNVCLHCHIIVIVVTAAFMHFFKIYFLYQQERMIIPFDHALLYQ